MNSPYHNTLHSSWRRYTTKYQSIREPEPGARKPENQRTREPEPENQSHRVRARARVRVRVGVQVRAEQKWWWWGEEELRAAPSPTVAPTKSKGNVYEPCDYISANLVAIYDL